MTSEHFDQSLLDRLQLTMITYGSSEDDPNDNSRFTGRDQRRVEIYAIPEIPANMMGDIEALIPWSHKIVCRMVTDIKHSQNWHCEFCDKLARETSISIASYVHLAPPRLVAYIQLVCDPEVGPCADQIREIELDMARETSGGPPLPRYNVPEVPGIVQPAAGSCCYCKSEESIGKTLSRCSKCKVTRYCGVDCQTADWTRHKSSCKLMKKVIWVWK